MQVKILQIKITRRRSSAALLKMNCMFNTCVLVFQDEDHRNIKKMWSATDEDDGGVDISTLEENGFMALDECGEDDEDSQVSEGGEDSNVGEGVEDSKVVEGDEDSRVGRIARRVRVGRIARRVRVGRIARWVRVGRITRIARCGDG